jgi:ribonuclease R
VLAALLLARGERGAREPHEAPAVTTEGRADLRSLPTVTIDPETAKDFDDAISIQREGDGLRAHVHIADVSYFVPAGTPLDLGAAERGFSVYVPGQVAPMLPHDLADDLCSLRPHQERLTVTVEVPFGPGLAPGTPTFYRSVIRSDARLTYAQAEAILSGNEKAAPEIATTLELAERLATDLRQRRFAGARCVSSHARRRSPRRRGWSSARWLEAEPHAHMLVEELMILRTSGRPGSPPAAARELTGCTKRRRAVRDALIWSSPISRCPPPVPDPDSLTPASAAALAAEISDRVADYSAALGVVQRRSHARPPGAQQARYASGQPRPLQVSPATPTATSHRRSRYPILVCHRALLREIGAADERFPADLSAPPRCLSAANAMRRIIE